MRDFKALVDRLESAAKSKNWAKCIITFGRLEKASINNDEKQPDIVDRLAQIVIGLKDSEDYHVSQAARLFDQQQLENRSTKRKKLENETIAALSTPQKFNIFDAKSSQKPSNLRLVQSTATATVSSTCKVQTLSNTWASSSVEQPNKKTSMTHVKRITVDAYRAPSKDIEELRRKKQIEERKAVFKSKDYGKARAFQDPALAYNIKQNKIEVKRKKGVDTTERVLAAADKNKRKHRKVVSLRGLVIEVLTENCDLIEEIGVVPLDQLDPVFKKCTPRQLDRIEYFNPHIVDETDKYWQPLCPKQTRESNRPEGGWRMAYWEWHDAMEQKYRTVAEGIRKKTMEDQNDSNRRQVAVLDAHAGDVRVSTHLRVRRDEASYIQSSISESRNTGSKIAKLRRAVKARFIRR